LELFVVAAVAVLFQKRLNGGLKSASGRRVERCDREEDESEAEGGQKLNLRSNWPLRG
jgi:hypothetical protein